MPDLWPVFMAWLVGGCDFYRTVGTRPSVVQLVYLVFEYMDHDLAGLSSCPNIQFSESQVKCYMHQLLCGLEHCHSRGVMHHDIKCANILVNNEGTLKIADFGLSNFWKQGKKHPLSIDKSCVVVTLFALLPSFPLVSVVPSLPSLLELLRRSSPLAAVVDIVTSCSHRQHRRRRLQPLPTSSPPVATVAAAAAAIGTRRPCHLPIVDNRTYNSSKGVRVSMSDDTDLDGTTQVPRQSPELTTWLTENLWHPTGEYSAATPPPLAYHDLAEIADDLPILFLYL
ncbi:hypothetical protein Taro_015415 [Colocasia esculenta]|uniref:[RNA-polymerase]-subunit kinase n=1 Tax=Colocasia esculenta TaxID=4460 RepID=A0A843UBG2_COLES|nr:hypothetical protein [Colocasia esculenta]